MPLPATGGAVREHVVEMCTKQAELREELLLKRTRWRSDRGRRKGEKEKEEQKGKNFICII